MITKRTAIFLVGCLGIALSIGLTTQSNEADIRHIEPNPDTGASLATVATGDLPLAHTDQLMAFDEAGEIVEGDATTQAEQVMSNLREVLSEVGASPSDLLKLNVYATDNDAVEQVRDYLADAFEGEAKPAVSYVVTALPNPDASVAVDAVALAAARYEEPERKVYQADDVYSTSPEQGHVAVSRQDGTVYISGQVAEGKPVAAMRTSLEHMHDRLAYLGLSADDVVHVKVFMGDISNAPKLKKKIGEYYRKKPSPPVSMVEWVHPGADVEVELIASRSEADEVATDEDLTFPLPPGLRTFPTYSRAAEIHSGDPVYFSGLYGDLDQDPEGQMRDIFRQMKSISKKAGTDFAHLAKATYYLDSWDVKGPLWGIRKEYYPPDRPPTSSLIPVKGVGREGARVAINMVGVVPE